MLLLPILLPLLLPVLAATPPPGSGEGPDQHPTASTSRLRGEELAREMIAAAGGLERWRTVRDLTFTLRERIYPGGSGKPFPSTSRNAFTRDPLPMLRVDVASSKNVHTRAYDGTEAWIAMDGVLRHQGSGTHQRVREAAKLTILWITFPFHLIEPGVRVEYIGTASVLGSEADVLQVTFQDDRLAVNPDDIFRYHVNRLTHLVMRDEYFEHGYPGGRVETMHGDHRTVSGLVKDHLREVLSPDGMKVLQRIELHELRFDTDLPRELFQKPPDPLASDPSAE